MSIGLVATMKAVRNGFSWGNCWYCGANEHGLQLMFLSYALVLRRQWKRPNMDVPQLSVGLAATVEAVKHGFSEAMCWSEKAFQKWSKKTTKNDHKKNYQKCSRKRPTNDPKQRPKNGCIRKWSKLAKYILYIRKVRQIVLQALNQNNYGSFMWHCSARLLERGAQPRLARS